MAANITTILHIDRSAFFHKVIKEITTKKKIKFLSCKTAADALLKLETEDVDIILTSKELPDLTAEEFIKKLNKSKFGSIPVIVITSTDSLEIREKFFSLGVVDYILKQDITEEKLARYIDNITAQDSLVMDLKKMEIAVLDDSQVSINTITSVLRIHGIDNVDAFKDPRAFLKQRKQYGIYLVDVIMPGISGEEVVMHLRKIFPQCVIIVISALNSLKTITQILNSGADDYLIKPFDGGLMMARLRANFRTWQLMQELNYKTEKLKLLTITDSLTGARNHRHLFSCLNVEISKVIRHNRDLSILLIDIDHFKHINDTYGHPAGDEVLKALTTIFQNRCRKQDIFGRYGGEEFLLIMPETSLEQGLIISDRIRQEVETFKFPEVSTETITFSGGLVQYKDETSKELLQKADDLLYQSKEGGRNKISIKES